MDQRYILPAQAANRVFALDQDGYWIRPMRWVISFLGLLLTAVTIYTAGFGILNEVYWRGGAVGLGIMLGILAVPLPVVIGPHDGLRRAVASLVDSGLLVAAVAATYWFFSVQDELETGLYDFNQLDNVFAALGIIALLEVTRRLYGLPFLVMICIALVYALFGGDLPWILNHAGFSLDEVLRTAWYSFDGVFGRPVAVVTGIILIFIVFGTVLEGVGAGEVLIRLASGATGRTRGGPAHAAVVASAVFGTMSGSSVANVVATGVFTIPTIIRRGFQSRFAGAVEAAASTGGQFMPPVMGAVAFIMADVTGIPYLVIVVAALVPALFYFASLFCAISVEAARLGITPVPPDERVRLTRRDLIQSLYLFLPLGLIVGLLVAGRSPAVAGFWATIAAVSLGFVFNAELRRRPQALFGVFAKAGENGAKIIVAVAAVGVIIGVINMTGLGLRFAAAIAALSENNLFLALVMTMLGSLVLGMGMPTVPAYLIIVLIMGPAIEVLGVPTLAVHLFVLYFGVLSTITPPVALAAFAAAPICGANPMVTAVTAMRIALIGFIVPFVFVYNPSLLLVLSFSPTEFTWIVARLGLAMWLLAAGLSGFDRAELGHMARASYVVVAGALLWPNLFVEATATASAILLLFVERWRHRAPAGPPITYTRELPEDR